MTKLSDRLWASNTAPQWLIDEVKELELYIVAQKQEWEKAYDIGVTCKHELAELRKQSQQVAQAQGEPALKQYMECEGDSEPDPLERLRFFCSHAMNGQDWLDSQQFFDAIRKGQGKPVAYLVYSPKWHEQTLAFEDQLGDDDRNEITPLYTSAPTIPEGWQLVPVEPTAAMIDAANAEDWSEFVRDVYEALLAAAPKP